MLKFLLSALATIGLAQNAFAQAGGVRLGEPAYGGTGCPAGSAAAVLSPDATTLSILFDAYVAEAGGAASSIDRKSCNLAVPVHIPQGFSVSVFKVDYRGFASIPRGGMGRFTAEYFFAGSRGPRASRYFGGGTDSDYLFSNEVLGTATVWSACGADTNLRVNTAMMVRSNRANHVALATVDSADVQAGLIYHLRWRRCR